MEEAIDNAINALDGDSSIKTFLTAHKAEVKNMCITEYDEERTLAELREEYKEEYKEEGRAEGKLSTLAELVKDGLLTPAQAAERVHMTVPEFQAHLRLQP